MNEFLTFLKTGNGVLLLTAIISLLGVSLAAVMNYHSNIVTNKAKIKSEEKIARLNYLKMIYDVLVEALADLYNNEPKNVNISDIKNEKEYESAINAIMDSNYYTIDKFRLIVPYLMKSDRDKLLFRYNVIEKGISDIQINLLNHEKKNDKESVDAASLGKKMNEFRFELKKVLSSELTTIMDILRE